MALIPVGLQKCIICNKFTFAHERTENTCNKCINKSQSLYKSELPYRSSETHFCPTCNQRIEKQPIIHIEENKKCFSCGRMNKCKCK